MKFSSYYFVFCVTILPETVNLFGNYCHAVMEKHGKYTSHVPINIGMQAVHFVILWVHVQVPFPCSCTFGWFPLPFLRTSHYQYFFGLFCTVKSSTGKNAIYWTSNSSFGFVDKQIFCCSGTVLVLVQGGLLIANRSTFYDFIIVLSSPLRLVTYISVWYVGCYKHLKIKEAI